MLPNMRLLAHRSASTASEYAPLSQTETNALALERCQFAEDLSALMVTLTAQPEFGHPKYVPSPGLDYSEYNKRLIDVEHYLESNFHYLEIVRLQTRRSPSRRANEILAFLKAAPPFDKHVWPTWPSVSRVLRELHSLDGFEFGRALTKT